MSAVLPYQMLDSKIKQMYKFVHIYVHYWLVWVYKFPMAKFVQIYTLGVGCAYLYTKPVFGQIAMKWRWPA